MTGAGEEPTGFLVQEAVPAVSTARSSVLTLISSAVGAGVLSFGYAFRQTGWLAGLIAVVAIASIEAFTLYVLSRYAEATQSRSYPALVRKLLGPGMSLLMCAVMFAYPFGSCIAYLMLTGDSFQPLLVEVFGSVWYTSRTAIIVGVGCLAILPNCFRTQLGALQRVSSLCVVALMGVVAIILIRSAQIVAAPDHSWAAVKAINTGQPLEFLSALVLIIFAFQCHTNVVTVFDELERQPAFFRPASSSSLDGAGGPTGTADAAGANGGGAAAQLNGALGQQKRPPKTEKLVGMIRVVLAALATCAVLYSIVGLGGYFAFPTSAKSDIMLSFGANDHLIQVARALIGCIQIAAYPINHFPARGAIREFLLQTTGRSFGGPGFVAVETMAFFLSTLALALRISDLGRIFEVVGGTCGNVLIFLMPGALLVNYARSKHRHSRQRRQQHAAAEAAALEGGQGLREPLLAEAAQAAPLYSLWGSKLFWSGVVLLCISAGLLLLTAVNAVRSAPQA